MSFFQRQVQQQYEVFCHLNDHKWHLRHAIEMVAMDGEIALFQMVALDSSQVISKSNSGRKPNNLVYRLFQHQRIVEN